MIMTLNNRQITITNFFENLGEKSTLNATNSFVVEDDTVFPELSGLENLELTSYEIENCNCVRIPLQGTYSKVNSVTVTYDDRSNLYTANIVLE